MPAGLHDLDHYVVRIGRKRLQVTAIGREDGCPWLSESHNQGIDC